LPPTPKSESPVPQGDFQLKELQRQVLKIELDNGRKMSTVIDKVSSAPKYLLSFL
jgi:hypothetical protein